MKVAMVTPWKVRCGIFTYTENLSTALAEQGVDIYIIRLPRFGLKTKELLESNVVAKVPVDKIDLIHVQHEYGLYQSFSSPFYEALKMLGKPIITTMHSVGNWDSDSYISKASDRIIVHNEFCARRLGYPNVIIPHGAKPAQRVPQDKAKQSLGAPLPMNLVGYCGFISNHKGLETLIDAMAKVPRAGLLIGGGWHTEESTGYINQLKQETLDRLPGRCMWLGFVPDEDLARVYAAMDIVVYPSRFSTESGALIMALSHGKAVIASNIAPFREKEKLGVLMTFKDTEDLTKKIKKLLKNESLRQEYEQKAYEYAEKTSWINIAKLHQSLYEDVLTSVNGGKRSENM